MDWKVNLAAWRNIPSRKRQEGVEQGWKMPGPLMSKGTSYGWSNCTAVTLRRSPKILESGALNRHARQMRKKFWSKWRAVNYLWTKHCMPSWRLTIDGNPKKRITSSGLQRSSEETLRPYLRSSGREARKIASQKQKGLLSSYDSTRYRLIKSSMTSWFLKN